MVDDRCVVARLHPVALAWAAGFFGGEGSTFVHRSRPSYRRLELSIGQSGPDGVPEVLLRFQAVVLGMGTIDGPGAEHMYFWRARTFIEAQATIALLWKELGPVKRQQAGVAFRTVGSQYEQGRLRARGPRLRHRPHELHAAAALSQAARQEIDRAWAAGFLDGEGHFGLPRSRSRVDLPDRRRIRVSATQNGSPGQPAVVLSKLVRILGGKIERHGEPDDHRWVLEGLRGVERVLALVRPWLGTVKQLQARGAIDGFAAQQRIRGDATKCARGHTYSHVYMSKSGPKRRCKACARLLGRSSRARQGVKPRKFTNVARRYTF
ncbi:MAG: hypothetical protein KGK34_04810 [Chloroflexota bacterium]|nr:hypothetical protein [Chloroflexota bacterium]